MRTARIFPILLLIAPLSSCSCDEEGSGLDDGGGSGGDGSGDLDGASGQDVLLPPRDAGPGSQCTPTGQPCTSAGTSCCSGICGTNRVCTEPMFCKGPNEMCTSNTECCTLGCNGGRCGDVLCRATGQSCTGSAQCCSTICTNGTCASVPAAGGNTCKTLGEGCSAGSECCSTNCQGGTCVRAFSCQANGDICRQNTDCCGNQCSTTTGTVGRCLYVSGAGGGGCTQDGNPCPNGGTNCCSRVCVDLGSGAPVCQLAGGCRLTGDWCGSNQSCCGGGDNPNGSVMCRLAPNGRCDNGNSCNPVGNICGARVLPDGGSVNASQNCCDGRTEVCKLDSAGIPRCFGGCPGGNCGNMCPNGYDPNNPACCIQPGQPCQFRDQCCGSAPCVPGAGGQLVCATPSSCSPVGAQCTPGADGGASACCSGTVCREAAQANTFACQLPPGGEPDPPGGRDAGPPPVGDGGGPIDVAFPDAAPRCVANGAMCTQGAQCCSGICTSGTCRAPSACQPLGQACTSGGDCCAGLQCNVAVGQTTGRCEGGAQCSNLGQACSPTLACCSGLNCNRAGTFIPCDGTAACTCAVNL